MKIHEYQSKELLKKYGVPVPQGRMTANADEAVKIAEEIGFPVVVKAQIHAGGRGKGGGIKLAKSAAETKDVAKAMIGMNLVTHQTGPEGKKVKKVLVEQAGQIVKEFYLGIVLDRATSKLVMMASNEGGVEIEEVAHKNPEKIIKVWIDPVVGLASYQARKLAFGIGLKSTLISQFVKVATSLYKLFIDTDSSMVEINPLVLTAKEELFALDGKLNFDDSALFRHKDIAQLLDPDEEDPNELEAHEYGLNYITLDGDIACLVNGAGLAMATMDIIKLSGGSPCNFLDVGGGATQETVTQAFKLILNNAKVKAIFVNIFGGILKCDVIAHGIIAAAKELGVKVPLVVRLLGTNVDLGRKVLQESGLNIISEDDFASAAKKVVAAARGVS